MGEVNENSCPRRLSSEEPEPPAADMARSAFGSVAGGQKEGQRDRSHDTRVYSEFELFPTRGCSSLT